MNLLLTAGGTREAVDAERFRGNRSSGRSGANNAGAGRCASEQRRGGDSNPRYGGPHTRFPVVPLQPLGHLSGRPTQ